LHGVEQALIGRRAAADVYQAAAERAADGAEPRAKNAFKVELIKRTVARALSTVGSEAGRASP
jgi:xanthine dehydrogenase YagS FAD-binding subunit